MNKTVDFSELITKHNQSSYNVYDHLKDLSVPELRNICDSDRNPFAVGLISITGDLNLGVIIRSSSLMGAQEIIVFGRRRWDSRSCVGSQNYIDISRVGGLTNELKIDPNLFVETIRNKRYLPIFVELGGELLGKFSWREKLSRKDYDFRSSGDFYEPIIIMGGEAGGPEGGIPTNIMNTTKEFPGSFCVSIPQKGVLRSHNVGAAFNIVAWDLCREMGWL